MAVTKIIIHRAKKDFAMSLDLKQDYKCLFDFGEQ